MSEKTLPKKNSKIKWHSKVIFIRQLVIHFAIDHKPMINWRASKERRQTMMMMRASECKSLKHCRHAEKAIKFWQIRWKSVLAPRQQLGTSQFS
jgi:hypothetical protein